MPRYGDKRGNGGGGTSLHWEAAAGQPGSATDTSHTEGSTVNTGFNGNENKKGGGCGTPLLPVLGVRAWSGNVSPLPGPFFSFYKTQPGAHASPPPLAPAGGVAEFALLVRLGVVEEQILPVSPADDPETE